MNATKRLKQLRKEARQATKAYSALLSAAEDEANAICAEQGCVCKGRDCNCPNTTTPEQWAILDELDGLNLKAIHLVSWLIHWESVSYRAGGK